MQRTYDYRGFIVDVSVEAEVAQPKRGGPAAPVGYVAFVTIHRANGEVITSPPLRLGDATGHPFSSDVEALNGGYTAARKLVDDLSSRDAD